MTPDSASEDKARAKAKAAASKKAAAAKAEAPDLAKEQEQLNRAVLEAAFKIADRVKARLLFLIVSDPAEYKFPPALLARKDLVLVMSDGKPDEEIRKEIRQVVSLPRIKLTRVGKVKLAVMRGLSKGLMEMGDKIVCVTGMNELGTVDSVTVLDIGREAEILSSAEVGNLATMVRPEIFEELLTIAVELATQGREGKNVGTLFVLGDTEKVMQLSRQMIFNPFQGYPEEERNILDPRLRETITEFSALDGAFIIRDDGVVMAAGRHLNAAMEDESLPRGLGSRHAAAAGISAVTTATALVVSESTGTVRIFRNGKIFLEIEKPGQSKS